MTIGDTTILRTSTLSFDSATYSGDGASLTAGWFHLRLEVLVNPHGGVILAVKRSTVDVTAPVWAAVAGMADYSDDALGIISGTVPLLTGFRGIYGHYTNNKSGAVSLFDQVRLASQQNP